MKTFLLITFTLWQREIVRFYRQPSRVIGAIASPLVFWLVIGSGVGTSFRMGESSGSYLHYFYPGTLLLVLLFSSIFSTISLIEDRKEGFLQAVLVSPASPWAIAFGKILGGATLAFLQAILFLCIAPFAGIPLNIFSVLQILGAIAMNALALTGLGVMIAWQFDSIQGFHAVMNLFLMPLWLLSGALFADDKAAAWIRLLMKLNPLSYGLLWIRGAFNPISLTGFNSAPLVTFVFAFITVLFSGMIISVPRRDK